MAEKRLSLSISEETYDKLKALKQDRFYDTSWSELYRFVLDAGVNVCTKKGKK